MKRGLLFLALFFTPLFCLTTTEQNAAPAQDHVYTVTLYPPRDRTTNKYDENRACLNFALARTKMSAQEKWHLGYGFVAIADEDWFKTSTVGGGRSVMQDLGKLNWSDSIKVPALEPLPILAPGERRQITVNTSGNLPKPQTTPSGIFAKIKVGHIYAVHVVDDDEEVNFYVLLRVEELYQSNRCTITWKPISAPQS